MTTDEKGPAGEGEANKDDVTSITYERQSSADAPRSQGSGASVDAGKPQSNYRPGAAYQPSEQALSKRLAEVLELLRESGQSGITRLTVPPHLAYSLPQYIHALREKRYVIDTIQLPGRNSRFGQYVLKGEPSADE